MRISYVAGKYRSDTERGLIRNIRMAEAVAIDLWKMGYMAFCPHLNTAHFGGLLPDEVWLRGGLAMLKLCALVVMVPNWKDSEGARKERAVALARNIPVYYWPQDRARLREEAVDDVPWGDDGTGFAA